MALVQTNRSAFTSAEAITSATQTTITRTSAANGLPGDSNGPPSGEYAVVFTDGTNFEIAYVTGGQGTTTLTLQRAAELIDGTQTALSSVPSGTTFFGVATAAGLPGPAGPAGGAVASANEVELTGTAAQTIATYTPSAAGAFLVGCRLRVTTATTVVTARVAYTDATGAQTSTWLNAVPKAPGSYDLMPIVISSAAGSAITVSVTAGTANQVYAGAAIWGTASVGDLMPNVISAAGDLAVGGPTGAAARLPIGAAGTLLLPRYPAGDYAAVFSSGGEVTTQLTPANLNGFTIIALANMNGTQTGAPIVATTALGPWLGNGRPGGGAFPGSFWVEPGEAVEVGEITNPGAGGLVLVVGVWDGASGTVMSASEFSVWQAGVQNGDNAAYSGAPPTAPVSATGPLVLGGNFQGTTNPFTGTLGRVAFFPFALTATQISNLQTAYASGVANTYDNAVLALGPLAYWKLDETSGTTAVDSSGNGNNGTYSSTGVTLAGATVPLTPPPSLKWVTSLTTSPPAATSVALTSGTAYQNTTGSDVMVSVPISYAATSTAAATCEVQRGSTSPGATVGTISKAAASPAITDIEEFFLPAGWYLTLTLTNATFAVDATVQPV